MDQLHFTNTESEGKVLFFGSGEFFPGVICLVTNHLLGASDTNEDNHGIMNTN